MKRLLCWLFCLGWASLLFSQEIPASTLPVLETCYDVISYNLEVKVDTRLRRIAGSNVVRFQVKKETEKIQLDLDARFKVAKVLFEERGVFFSREGNALILDLPRPLQQGETTSVTVVYGGGPQEAVNPPWKGGFVWDKDGNKKDWVGISCKNEGASLWWPVKDRVFDKPDSMQISVIVQEKFLAICNGRLRHRKKLAGNFIRWTWRVGYPIDPASVTMYIGDYKQFRKPYKQSGSQFDLDFYVLRGNVEEAKDHFAQVDEILETYEHFFGIYPFSKDGYTLVESPALGIAHQAALAYSQKFQNGQWGVDEEIVRQTAREWFGNSIYTPVSTDKWITESLVLYAEALLLEKTQGADSAAYFLETIKSKIRNESPIIQKETPRRDSDYVHKGVWVLQGLRFKLNNDELWFKALKAFATDFRGKAISTDEFIQFFSRKTSQNLKPFFEQYLYHSDLPVLQFKFKKKGKKSYLSFKWKTPVEGFEMPVVVQIQDARKRFHPQNEWQVYEGEKFTLEEVSFEVTGFLFETSLEIVD